MQVDYKSGGGAAGKHVVPQLGEQLTETLLKYQEHTTASFNFQSRLKCDGRVGYSNYFPI